MNNLNGVGSNQENLKIKLEKLYVKEINCKLPHAPNLFENSEFKEIQIEPNMEMNVKTQGVSINKFEVTLHAMIIGKSKNISLFNVDVQQSGIFTISVPQNQLEDIVKNYCVPILHPYLSQVVSNTIIQAGLPPIVLQPVQPLIDDTKINLNYAENMGKIKEDLISNNFN